MVQNTVSPAPSLGVRGPLGATHDSTCLATIGFPVLRIVAEHDLLAGGWTRTEAFE